MESLLTSSTENPPQRLNLSCHCRLAINHIFICYNKKSWMGKHHKIQILILALWQPITFRDLFKIGKTTFSLLKNEQQVQQTFLKMPQYIASVSAVGGTSIKTNTIRLSLRYSVLHTYYKTRLTQHFNSRMILTLHPLKTWWSHWVNGFIADLLKQGVIF